MGDYDLIDQMGEMVLIRERDEARAEVERLRDLIRGLRRGCECEYDYRCGKCQAVINAQEAVEKGEE